jgi:ATP-dependent Clp protease ATP-binding subunit ClpC
VAAQGRPVASAFDRFSDHARRALAGAQSEAQRHGQPDIGTEHLLLGLTALSDGTVLDVFDGLRIDPAEVRRRVEWITERGERPASGEIGLTRRAKRAIALSFDESHRLGDDFVGTEHLLLGLALEGEGLAAQVLADDAADPERVREEVAVVRSAPGWERES